MRKARLITGNLPDTKLIISDLSFEGEQNNKPEIICAWDDTNPDAFIGSTLRDIAIVMTTMTGAGIIKQLANELSDKLDLDPICFEEKLCKILQEYSQMSEEEANKRWEELGEKNGYQS